MRQWSLYGGPFKRLLQRAKLPEKTRLHDLRHTCATLLFSEGVHPKFVQELLGHATISITLDIYSHVLPGMGDQTVRRWRMRSLRSRWCSNWCSKGQGYSPVLFLLPSFSCKSSYFLSRGGGTRTHTVRILSPLPLPIGLRPHVVREYTSQVWPSSTVQQAPSG
jgi:hypothetical protein